MTYRVMIVDDEPVIRTGFTKLFKQSHDKISQVDVAKNGIEALEKMKRKRPDFLFTDIRMPHMDGLELSKYVREQYPDLMVAIISGYGEFEYAKKAIQYGVKDYILKPVTQKDIAATIEKMIKEIENHSRSYQWIEMADDWVNKMADAVWHLNRDALDKVMHEISNYCAVLPFSLCSNLISRLFQKFVQAVNQRGTYDFNGSEEIPSHLENVQEILDWFKGAVDGVMSGLLEKRNGKVKDIIEEVKNFIEENLSKDLSLEEVARVAGLNPSYFSQLFKQTMNETFVQYRTRRRIEKAKVLLSLPHYKITDISNDVGFSDQPHFTKIFKKNTGYTPSEYRAMLGVE